MLSKTIMVICFLVTLVYLVFQIDTGNSWVWKISTLIWIVNSYLQNNINIRYKNLINKITESDANKENI
jgi:hypothetical protein